MASNSYDNDLLNLTVNAQAKQKEREEIDILSNSMKAVAATTEGTFAIQDLLANPDAPKTQRAAAAQTLNPGIKASVGANGELSFTNIPGADTSYDYASNSRPPEKQALNSLAGNTPTAINDFDTKFRAIQGMTDSVEVMNTYASLNQSAASWINSKEAGIRAQVEQSMGIQVQRNNVKSNYVQDKEHYANYYAGVDQGPSDETIQATQLLGQAQAKVDAEVQKRLGSDPELAALKSRMGTLDTFVSSKYKDLLDKDGTSAGVNLISADRIDAAATAMGADSTNPVVRQQIATDLHKGLATTTQAEAIGFAAPTALIGAVAFGADGVTTAQAQRVLDAKTGSPDTSKFIVNQVKNFNTVFPDQAAQDSFKMPAQIEKVGTPKEKAAAQAQINALKVQHVLNDIQSKRAQAFKNAVGQWQAPQDPALAEIPTIIGDLKATDPEATITLDTIVNRMNWDTPDRAEKINKMTAYINSQAGTLEGNGFFGPPLQFADPLMTQQYVQTAAVYQSQVRKPQFAKPAFGIYN